MQHCLWIEIGGAMQWGASPTCGPPASALQCLPCNVCRGLCRRPSQPSCGAS